MHGEFKALVKEQIRHKLVCFEGEAMSSKVRSAMKLWSKCIFMVITKTTSGNVAFKVARMSLSIMESQDELIIRKSEGDETELEDDKQAALDDVGYDADLYITNQEVVDDQSF